MVALLASSVLLAQAQAVQIVSPQVVSVSMFKNGFVFVTREIEIKNGTANVVEVPQASLGTLWFWTSQGEIESITTDNEVLKTKTELPAVNFDQMLSANVGRSVSLQIRQTNQTVVVLDGEILSASGEIAVLKTSAGTQTIQKSSIVSINSTDPAFTWKHTTNTESNRRYYRLQTKGNARKVMMMSLERGMTWAPGYAIDLTDEKKMTLASKATILNDLTDVKGVDARLITGFPNLQFKDILDPFTANMSNDQWLGALNSGGPAGGGFGGGGRGRAAEMMQQNAYAPMRDAEDVNWGGNSGPEAGGEKIGDLFFYDLPKFNSKKNSRQYINLFRFETEYKHIYRWNIEDLVDVSGNYRVVQPGQEPVQEVWHTVKFKNTASRPLTTAPATIFNKGQIIGQSMMNYCAADGDCDISINKALDVRAESAEEEVERVRGAIKDRYENPRFDLVTVKGVLSLKNGRSEAISMVITKNLTGEVVTSTNAPEVVKTTRGLRMINSTAKLTWKPTVKAGDSLELGYTYKLYVPSQG